jgi:hypothetical protein
VNLCAVDHSYYKMHLYKHNADGSYDTHHVDMTDSHVHDFLSNHSQEWREKHGSVQST